MQIRLTPMAERQLAVLPDTDYERVGQVLDLLEDFPHLGKAYAADSPFAEKQARYFPVRVGRRRSYRITYRLLGPELVVLYIFPSTYPLTHPDHLKLFKGEG